MFERLPGLGKFLRSPVRRPHLIGLAVAGMVTAGLLVAVITEALPFVVIAVAGFIGTAALIFFDLQDGERDRARREATHQHEVSRAQMKRNQEHQKQPEHPAQRL